VDGVGNDVDDVDDVDGVDADGTPTATGVPGNITSPTTVLLAIISPLALDG
jgi:hypothetical protein